MTRLNDYHRFRRASLFIPGFIRIIIKKIYWKVIRLYSRYKYIKKGKNVEFGYRFRFARKTPFFARIGDGTILEDFNVWNAKSGDIVVGKKCWFGLYNIIMGPLEIGDQLSTGPNVAILGPRHAVFEFEINNKIRTVIGKNVWISTGVIIHFGVTIGDNAVIGAGSVVTRDVPANAFVAGNPARNLTRMAKVSWENQTNAKNVNYLHDRRPG